MSVGDGEDAGVEGGGTVADGDGACPEPGPRGFDSTFFIRGAVCGVLTEAVGKDRTEGGRVMVGSGVRSNCGGVVAPAVAAAVAVAVAVAIGVGVLIECPGADRSACGVCTGVAAGASLTDGVVVAIGSCRGGIAVLVAAAVVSVGAADFTNVFDGASGGGVASE